MSIESSDDDFISPDDFHGEEDIETNEEETEEGEQDEESENESDEEDGDDEGEDEDGEGASRAKGGKDEGSKGKSSKSEKQELEDLLAEESLDKKVRIKVDGEERVVTIRELQKLSQLEAASHKKMQSAAETDKRARQIAEMAEKDPIQFLKMTGQDPYKMAEKLMIEQMELEEMSPEQRQIHQLRRENETYKQKAERVEREQYEARQQRETETEKQKLAAELEEAWAETGLPKSQDFDRMVYQVMWQDHQAKTQQRQMGLEVGESLTAREAAGIVKENWLQSVGSTFGGLDAEAILALLGQDTVKKIRQHDIKRVNAKSSPKFSKSKSPGDRPASGKSKKSGPLTEAEYRKWQESL